VARDTRWKPRRTLGVVALYAGVAFAYLVVRYAVVGRFIQKAPPRSYLLLFGQPLLTRIFTAFEVLAIYLRLLFFPLTLSADYSYRQVPLLDAPDAVAVAGMLAALVLAGGFMWAVRRRAWTVVCALGFFLVSYSVVANFPIPLQVLVAERLMYLPSVGFCLAVAWAWAWLAWRLNTLRYLRYLPHGLLALLVFFYSVRTVVRNFDWRDAETIYAATVRAAPQCFAARFNYSAILMRQPGRSELALQQLEEAYRIRQDHYPALVNLSTLYLNTGHPEKAREIAQQGLALRPDGKEIRGVLESAEAQLRRGQASGGGASRGERP
jgi:tetratricopeptide (TPR) repeat protein